jgi:phosphoglycolate phosphatase-like HAD superfamily hydrolase
MAVTWGFQSRELLAVEEPDYILNEPRELIDVFESTKDK